MATAMSLRIALAIILVPAVAATSGGDALSNSLLGGITPLLALFGQDFANHYLSQSTSWLDSIVFAVGPLGIPAAITAAIRVSGYKFLKGLIGRATESEASIAKELTSSTSNEVCELWDGDKVVRLEATKPLIQELIYAEGKWYDLKKAEESEKEILKNSKDTNTREANSKETISKVTSSNTKTYRSGSVDLESQLVLEIPEKNYTDPPNLSLNLIPDHRWWELSAAAILGISLQLLVLAIAGLTTFYPHWKGEFSVQLYEFYCMVGGTLLLTFGLIICALAVEQRTVKKASEGGKGKQVCILWLQRGRSDGDESYKPYILGVERKRIRTSRLRPGSPSNLWKALTLAGTLAAMLGYIVQFIGLGGMHWPTQAVQFAVTLIMTGVRAFIRRAPPPPRLQGTLPTSPPKTPPQTPSLREEIPDKHEIDWLATKFREPLCKGKHDAQVWQTMTVESLSEFQKLDHSLLTSIEKQERGKKLAGETALQKQEREKRLARETALQKQRGKRFAEETALERLEREKKFTGETPREKLEREKWIGQAVLTRRQRLGALCEWTGPARKYAISVATAIDEVMNILNIPSKEPFHWPLDVLAYGTKRRIWFTIEKREGDTWKSDFSKIEAALSLGLFGVELKTLQGRDTRKSNEETPSSKPDWLRLNEEKFLREKSMRLLGPNTTASRRDLLWWCGPGNGKLKEVWLHKHNGGLEIERHQIAGFGDLVPGLWKNEGKLKFGQRGVDIYKRPSGYLAAVSDTGPGLLYAQHMFSAFMWTIATKEVKGFSNAAIEKKWEFIPSEEDSWTSLQLSEKTVEKLARCVQKAGLGDMEDAYLSVIPPLSYHRKLPSPVEVFKRAREIALKEQSQEKWESAYKVYRLLFRNFVMFGARDEMAIKTTALFTEFFRLLCRTTELQVSKIVEVDEDEARKLKELRGKVLDDLKEADRGVMNSLVELYKIQGWFKDYEELRRELQVLEGDGVRSGRSSERSNYPRDILHKILGQEALHITAMEGHEDTLGELLQQEEQLREKDFFGRTALHYAACKTGQRVKDRTSKRSDGATRLLLKSPGDKDEIDRYGMTALHIAAERGHLRGVQKLINVHADTTTKAPGERTALHLAVLGCHSSVISELLKKKGCDVVDRSGRTALHLAALSKDVEELLQQEENSERKGGEGGEEGGKEGNEKVAGWVSELAKKFNKEKDINGKTVLHLAAEYGRKAVVQWLLEKGADVNATDNSKCTALHLAAQNGHETVVQILLKEGANVDAITNDQWTALCIAAQNGYKTIVQMLLEKGATVDAKINDQWTALHLAAQNGHTAVVRILLEKGATVNGTDNDQWTALHIATQNGHTAVVRMLLEKRANVNATNKNKMTALHFAAYEGHKAVMQWLLEKRADVNATDNDGWTALHWAALNGHETVVQILLEKRAAVDAKNNDQLTALHIAAQKKHTAVMQILLEKGADVNVMNDDGWTALHTAALNGHETVVQILLEKGANVNATNKNKKTALYFAAQKGHKAVMQWLLEKGADVNVTNDDGWTALHTAALNGHETVVQILLEKGANVDEIINDQWTALYLAAQNGHTAIVRILLEKGATVNGTDNDQWTALHIAAQNGHTAVIRMLLERGADINETNEAGKTALCIAVEERHEAVIRLLLEKGAAVDATDKDKKTALYFAAREGHKAIIQLLLLEKGTIVNVTNDDGWTALYIAAEKGHEAVMRLLLEKGADIDAGSDIGKTALHRAAKKGHEAVIGLLLEKGADFEAVDNDGRTALHVAAQRGHEAVVLLLLLEKGAAVKAADNNRATPLHLAAQNGHEAVVQLLLLEKEAAVEAADNNGATALHLAARKGHEAVAALLLEKGTDFETVDNDGRTALYWAARSGHEAVVGLLLKKGVDIDAKCNNGETALYWAARGGHEAVVGLLLKKGADIDAKCNNGETALYWAAVNGHEAVVGLLLERGADIDAKCNNGETALYWAAANGHEAVVDLLLEKGADIEVKSNNGGKVLHWAAANGYEAMVGLLLEKGAVIEAKSNNGGTALHWAAANGREAVAGLLLQEGADIDAADNDGKTALQLAVWNGHEAVVGLLLEKGVQNDTKAI